MKTITVIAVAVATIGAFRASVSAGEIHMAVQSGDLAKVTALIGKKADLANAADENGNLPLHTVAMTGRCEIAALLLESGARVDGGDRDDSTPLDVASQQGHKALAVLLLKHGADPKHKDNNGMTALHFAAYEGHADVADVLLDKGADINAARVNASTPLHGAALGGHEAVTKLLLKRGADLEAKNAAGYRPLVCALLSGRSSLVRFLLDQGADPNAATNGGETPLEVAAWRELDVNIVKTLLEKGADPNGSRERQSQPLNGAIRRGRADVVALLLAKGADIAAADYSGAGPVAVAAREGHSELIRVLAKAGADVNAKDPHFGRTALHWAAIKGNSKLAETLLRHGAGIDATNAAGTTPVQLAARYGHRGVVDALTAKGASAKDLKKNYGASPLLTEKLGRQEAVLWYLGHCGWAVKTKNHVLVFDYWNPEGDPAEPWLANGHINPSELTEQNVTVFVTHEHGDHFDPSIFTWADKMSHVRYVYGMRPEAQQASGGAAYNGPAYEYIGPRQERTIDGMKISTIAANDAGVGFLVEVDGLSIYHAGDHAGWADGQRDGFIGEIDYLAGRTGRIDVAMLNVSGCHTHDPERLKEGTMYTLGKLKPRVMIPTHAHNSEYKYREAATEVKAAGFKSEVYCPKVRGDYFVFKGGSAG